MGTPQKRIFIIAGEASGDMRAAGLVSAVLKSSPNVTFIGVGGKHMADAGVEILADIDQLGVVGIWDVITHFPIIKKVFHQVIDYIRNNNIDAVVLVDYPGFNLRIAKIVKGLGIKVIYYVSPQVWAWKERRIERIKKIVDRMMVLFPFEPAIYAKYGMKADYVGHPLLDEVKISQPPSSVKALLGFKPEHQIIGLLPGSRLAEIERHLPLMLKAAEILESSNKNRRFMLLKAATISRIILEDAIKASGVPVLIYDGPQYNGIGAMDAAIVASGTATLETGLLLKPMVIIYKTAWLTYYIAKMFIKISYIGLVNVVAGKKIIEELIQNDATAQRIANSIEDILTNPNTYAQMTNDLAQVRSLLGHSGASQRAAGIILEEISN